METPLHPNMHPLAVPWARPHPKPQFPWSPARHSPVAAAPGAQTAAGATPGQSNGTAPEHRARLHRALGRGSTVEVPASAEVCSVALAAHKLRRQHPGQGNRLNNAFLLLKTPILLKKGCGTLYQPCDVQVEATYHKRQ